MTHSSPAPDSKACGARTVFWPDVEACDAECALPAGHDGRVHEDDILGGWDEDDMVTTVPETSL